MGFSKVHWQFPVFDTGSVCCIAKGTSLPSFSLSIYAKTLKELCSCLPEQFKNKRIFYEAFNVECKTMYNIVIITCTYIVLSITEPE